jgi:hypothetical protein
VIRLPINSRMSSRIFPPPFCRFALCRFRIAGAVVYTEMAIDGPRYARAETDVKQYGTGWEPVPFYEQGLQRRNHATCDSALATNGDQQLTLKFAPSRIR